LDKINISLNLVIPFIKKPISTPDVVYYVFLFLYIFVKVGIYTILVNADNNKIKGDFIYCLSEFCSNTFSIFSSFLGFVLRVGLLAFTIVGNIYFINVCGYFSIFTIKFDSSGNPYIPRRTYEESSKLAKGFILLLMVVNTFVVAILYFLYFFTPILPRYKDINITAFIKTIFFDSIFVYYIHTGYSLQKYKNKLQAEDDEKIMKEKHIRRLANAGRTQL
jgi:hypothetical protein